MAYEGQPTVVKIHFTSGTAEKQVPLGTELATFDEIMRDRVITDPEGATESGILATVFNGSPALSFHYRFAEGDEIVARTKLADYLAFRAVDQLNAPETPKTQEIPAEIQTPAPTPEVTAPEVSAPSTEVQAPAQEVDQFQTKVEVSPAIGTLESDPINPETTGVETGTQSADLTDGLETKPEASNPAPETTV